jgi:hypothetical protein
VLDRVQAGWESARLTEAEYRALLGALLAAPSVHTV